MTAELSRWWYLDLAAEFPELEIYSGSGWGPAQELALIELGERVLDEETHWLFTHIYSKEKDRIWAAVSGMFSMVIARIRRDRRVHPSDEYLLRVPAGQDPDGVCSEEIPSGWRPDVQAWDEGRLP